MQRARLREVKYLYGGLCTGTRKKKKIKPEGDNGVKKENVSTIKFAT